MLSAIPAERDDEAEPFVALRLNRRADAASVKISGDYAILFYRAIARKRPFHAALRAFVPARHAFLRKV
jgi:hypothetical protein